MISAAKIQCHPRGWIIYLGLLFWLSLVACSDGGGVSQISGRTMGTSWNVSFLPGSGRSSPEQLQQEIAVILAGVDSSMSTYRQKSEISQFNQAVAGEWFAVSDDFFEVLEAALLIGHRSRGAYDVTVGPLVDRWGFGPGHQAPQIPPEKEIRALLESVGQGKLQIDPATNAVLKPLGMSLDFSSIAKGYAVDKVAEYLKSQQIDNFLVEVGGELRLSGHSGRGDAWRVAVEQPDGGGRNVARTIALSDVAVATSGDYRNYFELNDKRYSHNLNPITGHPVEHDLVSVTVVHPSAMMADGWATALIVLGATSAAEVAQEEGLAVYFIRREGDSYLSSHSEAFAPYLQTGVNGD